MSSDIPDNDDDLDQFQKTFISAVAADPDGYGLTGVDIKELQTFQGVWGKALPAHKDAQAVALVRTQEKDAAKGSLVSKLRGSIALPHPAGGPSTALVASLRRAAEGARSADLSRRIASVSAADVGAAVCRFLPLDRRVVVITTPRGHGEQRVAAR